MDSEVALINIANHVRDLLCQHNLLDIIICMIKEGYIYIYII